MAAAVLKSKEVKIKNVIKIHSDAFKVDATISVDHWDNVKETYLEIYPDLKVEMIPYADYVISQIPEEFRDVISDMAYDRGHAGGREEVAMITESLVNDLGPAIKAFEARIRQETKAKLS